MADYYKPCYLPVSRCSASGRRDNALRLEIDTER